jgi:apolipoprotein N-acyltransferase
MEKELADFRPAEAGQNKRRLKPTLQNAGLLLASFFIVAFGQPAWIPLNGVLAAAIGYALFWRVLLEIPSKTKRFWLCTLWFGCVQLLQLSWFTSHPYAYIYAVYSLLCFGLGMQFGVIGLLITVKNMRSLRMIAAIAALWTLMEWSRLHYLSGLSWNPAGLSLSSTLYGMQAASLGGVFMLSFWVFAVNLLGVRCWMQYACAERPPKLKNYFGLWAGAALLPYAYGLLHVHYHDYQQNQVPNAPKFSALLVQPAFPIEENSFTSIEHLADLVTEEWVQLLALLNGSDSNHHLDLVALPEYLVPLGTYHFIYPLQSVLKHFYEQFGPDSLARLPPLEFPYYTSQDSSSGVQLLVNNAFWAQGLANLMQTDLIIGLEDAEQKTDVHNSVEYYSAAMLFHPSTGRPSLPERYEKRVLVPMGEYIPFEFCRKWAARYGVFSSFTPGKTAKTLQCGRYLISPSICYEETFGEMMRQGRQLGADLLVNLTSDVWYPNSKLPQQHLDHARLRTVENGVPLLRACNTGVTAAIDSLGRNVAVLGGAHPEQVEWQPGVLLAEIPMYSYSTLYSKFGDAAILLFSFGFIFFALIKKKT